MKLELSVILDPKSNVNNHSQLAAVGGRGMWTELLLFFQLPEDLNRPYIQELSANLN